MVIYIRRHITRKRVVDTPFALCATTNVFTLKSNYLFNANGNLVAHNTNGLIYNVELLRNSPFELFKFNDVLNCSKPS